MNKEQQPFTIKCKEEEMEIVLRWIEDTFPSCYWASGSRLTSFMPSLLGSNDIYFILEKVGSGYKLYWNDECDDSRYDIYEFSESIVNKFNLPSKKSLMDFLEE